jgi:phage baseplate assembly protein W
MRPPALPATATRALGLGLACELVEPGMDLGRDLRLTAGPNGTDLRTVAGIDNLDQCLAVALTTALGSDVFNTAFGFDGLSVLTEEANAGVARERVRVSVINVLAGDARVRSIVDLRMGAEVGPGRALEVTVAFRAITGDEATVTVGGGGAGA